MTDDMLLHQELEDRLALHALLPRSHHLFPDGGHARLLGPGLGALRPVKQRGQDGLVG